MEVDYKIFLYLGVILLSTKAFGILARKMGLPQVVGALLAGIVIGPVALNVVPSGNTVIVAMAEIGVVMLMFSAGLETNIGEIKKNGFPSVVITLLGVIIPFAGGFLCSWAFNGFEPLNSDNLIPNLFFGVILTATSVGITVETLKEMGKLKGKVGTSILAAAVLDDIIGIIILTVIIGLGTGNMSIGKLASNLGIFFAIAIGGGIVIHFAFKWLSRKFPVTRRLPIFGLVVCFIYAWVADHFGIAGITGAFIAGMIMSNMQSTAYVERKIDINSYMLFSPIFFASIGIEMNVSGFTIDIFWFSVLLTVVALLSKILGCGLGAKLCGYSMSESLKVGFGMMARGEVGLIVAQKGVASEIIDPKFMPSAVIMVVISSLATPIGLKLMYRTDKKNLFKLEGDEPPSFDEPLPATGQGADMSYLYKSGAEAPFDMRENIMDEMIEGKSDGGYIESESKKLSYDKLKNKIKKLLHKK